MAEHPEAQARAVAEVQTVLGGHAPTPDDLHALPWLTATLKETMRLCPAGAGHSATDARHRPAVARQHPCTCRAAPCCAARPICCTATRVWAEPEAFQPERFLPDAPEIPRGAYMPFGQGPRVCLGQHFAMLEMSLVAAMLLQAFELSPSGDPAPACAWRSR